MKVLSFGSFNIDHTYEVEHFVCPGETEHVQLYHKSLGGKGFNQTLALIKAGAHVLPAGCIGEDGNDFMEVLQKYNQTTALVKQLPTPTGHAIIQVADSQNSIIVYGGANQRISKEQADEAMTYVDPGDILLIQNEINQLPYLIEKAYQRKMKIVFNMAPMSEDIIPLLDRVHLMAVNEVEALQLLHITSTKETDLIEAFRKQYPHKEVLLTLGKEGSVYLFEDMCIKVPAFKVKAVDTTAAGDTYMGYYLTAIMENRSIQTAMMIASKASALTVSTKGSSISIPKRNEVAESIIKDLYHNIPPFKDSYVTYKKGMYNRDVPIFDDHAKKFVYALYKSGLFDLFSTKDTQSQKIDCLNLIDSLQLLIADIRMGHLDKRQLAKKIKDGTIQSLDAHIRTLLED